VFNVHRGMLALHHPPDSGSLWFLSWPVLVYRVTAPVTSVRHLNIFEKVVLALCRAGLREPAEIARRIHRETELCEYIRQQLIAAGHLDARGVPTEAGLRILAEGHVSEDSGLVVTHVFQDPGGDLWPRTCSDLTYEPVTRVRDGQADLRVGTAGRRRPVTAYVVPPAAGQPSPPRSQQVIAAVNAHRSAQARQRAAWLEARGGNPSAQYEAEQELAAMATELRLRSAPEAAELHKVIDISQPTQEYLLAWIEMDAEHDDGAQGWLARDPFGLDPSLMAQQLVTRRLRGGDSRIATALTDLVAVPDEHLFTQYRKDERNVGRRVETRIVERLGPEIRTRPALLELFTEMETEAARGSRPAAAEGVAREAFRIYEYVITRMALEYPAPMPPSWFRRTSRIQPEELQEHLERYAGELGLRELPEYFRKRPQLLELASYPTKSPGQIRRTLAQGFPQQTTQHALVSAADANSLHQGDHPLRALAARRPSLLADVNRLRGYRNRGSHSQRDTDPAQAINWCRDLALDIGQASLALPLHYDLEKGNH
jgi:hypothetical protein